MGTASASASPGLASTASGGVAEPRGVVGEAPEPAESVGVGEAASAATIDDGGWGDGVDRSASRKALFPPGFNMSKLRRPRAKEELPAGGPSSSPKWRSGEHLRGTSSHQVQRRHQKLIAASEEGSSSSPKEATLKRELDEAPRESIIDEATERKVSGATKILRKNRVSYSRKKATQASEETKLAPPWKLKRPKRERSSGSTETDRARHLGKTPLARMLKTPRQDTFGKTPSARHLGKTPSARQGGRVR